MQLSVSIGEREVISSASLVVLDAASDVLFNVADLAFRIYFKETDDKKVDVVGEVAAKELKITLQNFDNPLGTSWNGPVGFIDNRELHMGLFVHSVGEGAKRARLLNYTFSLGRVKND